MSLALGYIKESTLPRHPTFCHDYLPVTPDQKNHFKSCTKLFITAALQQSAFWLTDLQQLHHQLTHTVLYCLGCSAHHRQPPAPTYNTQAIRLLDSQSQCLLNDLLTFLPARDLLPVGHFLLCPTGAKSFTPPNRRHSLEPSLPCSLSVLMAY